MKDYRDGFLDVCGGTAERQERPRDLALAEYRRADLPVTSRLVKLVDCCCAEPTQLQNVCDGPQCRRSNDCCIFI